MVKEAAVKLKGHAATQHFPTDYAFFAGHVHRVRPEVIIHSLIKSIHSNLFYTVAVILYIYIYIYVMIESFETI